MNSAYEILIVILTEYGLTKEKANDLLKLFLDEEAYKYLNQKADMELKEMFP